MGRAVFLVAGDTKTHLEFVRHHHPVHERHLPVTLAAVETAVDVHGVVEIGELGYPVHPLPDHRMVFLVIPALLGDIGIGPDDPGK